jgi:cellulose biosynthesis protein BcsQ
VVAVCNIKGGVGKTTTAINLSYLAATAGQRVLLWDLDLQAAATFAFRVRPRVAGFGKKSLESGQELSAAIKETDYNNLDLLPADFAYRKLDRLLGHFGKPERVVTALLDTLGRDYDVVFLDCAAGFSLLTEGVVAAADTVLVPTIPTVLSLRTVARLIKWADRCDLPSKLAVFFSMVDRRKILHRRACEWSASHPAIFLAGQIPYASVVEQVAVRRMPLGAFAGRDSATTAFAEIWAELQARLQRRAERTPRHEDTWADVLAAIESLIVRLESGDWQEPGPSRRMSALDADDGRGAYKRLDVDSSPSPTGERDVGNAPMAVEELRGGDAPYVIHRFDTDHGDLQRCDRVLELREHNGHMLIVAARSGSDDGADQTRAHVRIDSSWGLQILSGEMSPLVALERRLGRPGPGPVESIRTLVAGRRLRRIDSRFARNSETEGGAHVDAHPEGCSYSPLPHAAP